ncbi:MAG: 3-ketoacyl-ACP reductase [Pirellulaceae bacterium]|nr:MAG: 3-ketoacyl-ACP reductase [Pirellulaceae bacterium]
MQSVGPVAVVTGSSRGIGRAIAQRLAQDGYRTVVNYVRNAGAARDVCAAIQAAGGQAIAVQGDVASANDRQHLLQVALDHFGRVDVLVNNAGITSPGRQDLLEVTEENFHLVMCTNLYGPFFLSQLVSRWMIQAIADEKIPRGIIVNITSLSAYTVSTNRADYCMAKAALHMMTHLLAARLAPHNIRVYEVCPGIIASDMTAPVREKYDRLIAEGLTPIRRWGEPEDVARVVAAVVKDDFDFCTGTRIDVDGGFHIRRL